MMCSLRALVFLGWMLCEGLWAESFEKEFRGAWVASVYNLDWPSKPGLSADRQQAELRGILDRAKGLGLNAILLQVRPAGDALYPSSTEPWSAFLAGRQGRDPGYDPLAFAIREGKARGIAIHAWFNPFRAATNASGPFAAGHISRRQPGWVRRHGNLLWIDPGVPAAREHVLGVILDVVRRYGVAGVHIDDYFYPYPTKGAGDFADGASWGVHGAAGGLSRGDWRRQNINRFVESLYREVKAAKPEAMVGISPFGIWRPGVPEGIEAGLDAYGSLYCDARLWLEQGWCDYLSPQLYWSIDPPQQSFPVLLRWWRAQSRAGRPIWPGIATERVGAKRPASEIARQIALTRSGESVPGHIHWNMKALMENRGGVADLLRREVYGPADRGDRAER
jgi:uncharacterized lipoprotein YddW (UPF0748 family)